MSLKGQGKKTEKKKYKNVRNRKEVIRRQSIRRNKHEDIISEKEQKRKRRNIKKGRMRSFALYKTKMKNKKKYNIKTKMTIKAVRLKKRRAAND